MNNSSYTKEALSALNRKELQKLCKQTDGKVKANKKTAELVEDLAGYFVMEADEMEALEAEINKYGDVELNTTWNSTRTIENSSNGEVSFQDGDCVPGEVREDCIIEEDCETQQDDKSSVEEQVTEEVEEKVEEKVEENELKLAEEAQDDNVEEGTVKLPDSGSVALPTTKVASAIPVLLKKKRNRSLKEESVDVFLAKKQARAEKLLNYSSKRPGKKENDLNKSNVLLPSSSDKPSTSIIKSRKSVRVDAEVTINFTPRVSTPNPAAAALKDDSKGLASGKRKSMYNSRKSEIGNNRKSFMVNSPAAVLTPKAKTPAKFDLHASLKKPLTYKPHTGKLKNTYFTVGHGLQSTSAKEEGMGGRKSAKEMSRNATTREKRRNEAAGKRNNNRNTVLNKKRGLTS